MGGLALKGRTKLSHAIDNPGLGAYTKRARFFQRAAAAELASLVGHGRCGVIPSALLKLAAQCMALAEAALAAGETDQYRKLSESARMHLVYAREIASKDGVARSVTGGANPVPWLVASSEGEKR